MSKIYIYRLQLSSTKEKTKKTYEGILKIKRIGNKYETPICLKITFMMKIICYYI